MKNSININAKWHMAHGTGRRDNILVIPAKEAVS
jgi:hypothetical protein